MPHVHPFGPPNYVPYATAVSYLEAAGLSAHDAAIGAAIAQASSTIDTRLIDDTPALHKYNVGAWQFNYYGAAYGPLAALYGTPAQLVAGDILEQSRAAANVFRLYGWQAWPAWQTGAYLPYLLVDTAVPVITQAAGIAAGDLPPANEGDWSQLVTDSAVSVNNGTAWLSYYTGALSSIR